MLAVQLTLPTGKNRDLKNKIGRGIQHSSKWWDLRGSGGCTPSKLKG